MLNRDLPVPIKVQLAGVLRDKISAGEITSRLPSILTLAQEYEVSHRTAQEALVILRDEGAIVAVRGLGYYVSERPPGK